MLPNTLGSSSVCYDLAWEVEDSQFQSTEQSVKPYELNNNVIKKKRIFPKGLIEAVFFILKGFHKHAVSKFDLSQT